jgi:hypothetical protein
MGDGVMEDRREDDEGRRHEEEKSVIVIIRIASSGGRDRCHPLSLLPVVTRSCTIVISAALSSDLL